MPRYGKRGQAAKIGNPSFSNHRIRSPAPIPPRGLLCLAVEWGDAETSVEYVCEMLLLATLVALGLGYVRYAEKTKRWQQAAAASNKAAHDARAYLECSVAKHDREQEESGLPEDFSLSAH